MGSGQYSAGMVLHRMIVAAHTVCSTCKSPLAKHNLWTAT
jgi:hypothetical protein